MNFIVMNDRLEQIEILDQYESVIWTDRYAEAGDFEIYTPVSSRLLDLLISNFAEGRDLYLRSSVSDHLMIIDEYNIKSEYDSGSKIFVNGKSAEYILDRRIVWNKTEFSSQPLQDVVERLLNENLINPSDSNRKISGFIFKKSSDPNVLNSKVSGDYFGDSLYTVVKELCESCDIGFRVTLDNETFVFELYSGDDHSYDQTDNPFVIFSTDYQNLGSSNYVNSKLDYKNVAAVQISNKDNTVLEYNPNGFSGYYRREISTPSDSETTSTSDPKFLESGRQILNDNKKEELFEGQINQSNLFVYGQDFLIGDIVQIRNEYGIEARSRISEIVISHSQSSYDVYPTFETI